MHHSLAILNESKKCCMPGLNRELRASLNKIIVISFFATQIITQNILVLIPTTKISLWLNNTRIKSGLHAYLHFVSKQLEIGYFQRP